MRRHSEDGLLSLEFMLECFDLNVDTGILSWRFRPRHHFKSDHAMRSWNTRYAGSVAVSVDAHGYYEVRIKNRHYKSLIRN